MAPQMKEVSNQNANKTNEVQQQVDEVIGIMHTNIDKVVQRGEKLDTLQNKTEELQNGALSFKKTSVEVKNEM
jgi:vesicle-associated membrane protein 4